MSYPYSIDNNEPRVGVHASNGEKKGWFVVLLGDYSTHNFSVWFSLYDSKGLLVCEEWNCLLPHDTSRGTFRTPDKVSTALSNSLF